MQRNISEVKCVMSLHCYPKAYNKYMKDYDPKKEPSCLMFWNVNNLYGLTMSRKLPVHGFKQKNDKFNFYKDFIQNCYENSTNRNIFEYDVQYLNKVQIVHRDLPFQPEKMKVDMSEKLMCNLHRNKKYVIHMKAVKQALDHGVILDKVHEVIA